MEKSNRSVSFTEEFGKFLEFNLPFIYTDDIDLRNQPIPEDQSSPNDVNETASWLLSLCENHISRSNAALNPQQLCREILEICNNYEADAHIEARLFELIGETGLDIMSEIIGKKILLNRISLDDVLSASSTDYTGPPDLDKMSANQRRKYEKKMKEQQQIDEQSSTSNDWLKSAGFSEAYLDNERMLGLQGGNPRSSVDTWRDNLAPAGTLEYHEKKGLPANAKRKYEHGYEEVFIPAPNRPPAPVPGELVEISSLEPWAQLAFEGTKKLNRIQSKVLHVAYNTSENMLICAPTGAGKTNIAMLTFLQLVKQHISYGNIDKQAIKAIYIAPMKALAQEVVTKFGERLRPLGLLVKEMTGDTQLTRQEVADSQLIVTTPEKWDVVTRKGGDGSLGTLVSLIIIDEVHLLADDRGAVIETIVARTHRYIESSQTMVRIVGLSATLPNYKDVAMFLRVSPNIGLFHFGPEFRPVPLDQTFIGVIEKQRTRAVEEMNRHAYKKMIEALMNEKQVMIFVHSRKDTSKTIEAIRDLCAKNNSTHLLENIHHEKYTFWKKYVDKSRSKEVQQLFGIGCGVHHAGMLRPDRTLVEQLFECGVIKVLCCTATLAWGVNLPAHTVIIKGTELYDPERGGFVDLSILDVLQIFGRAGRPQYDNTGHAILLTSHKSLNDYLNKLGHQAPIESNFIKALPDHMSAEIVNGTINNIKEAIAWLSYTFLFIRMCKNPIPYGISFEEVWKDPSLENKRLELIKNAAEILNSCMMIRYDKNSGNLGVTDVGRIASHYYIKYSTIDAFNNMLREHMSEKESFHILCSSSEFEQLKVRPEEMKELEDLKSHASIDIIGAIENTSGKVNVLLQGYLNQRRIDSFTLQSDINYIAQNASRITRALFEICLKRGWSIMSKQFLSLSKCIDRRMRNDQNPLRQFNELPGEVIKRLEDEDRNVNDMIDLDAKEIGQLCHNQKLGSKILNLIHKLPFLEIESVIKPITRGILRLTLSVTPGFIWSERYHGTAEAFWIWVEDEPLPPQYYIYFVSDKWVGCEDTTTISFQHLILPDLYPGHTDLLDMHPIPRTALRNINYENIYKFSHFNPIQTQTFHTLYNTDVNALIGAPTGSGKTITSELALLRLLTKRPGAKTVYIAPLKALARERLADWQRKFGDTLGLTILELSGDITPDLLLLKRADRGWAKREYVQKVELVIIDEIHLLGEDRGPVLEAIVSRMRYIAVQTQKPIRFVGLSTALANAKDLADWLGIGDIGVYNFRPAVRPVPMQIFIQGFPGKHYCPRMATMNKPAYASIMEHSPAKPVLVFVSSRRQTRLTALDLISYCVSDEFPKKFLHMPEDEVINIAHTLTDQALRDTVVFGIGIHHAGLDTHDRVTVEELFCSGKIQVLVCTSTLAWGVNFPAHLVIVKGTEYFDGKTGGYVDFPVTDVLQMMGRAGRPQFDDSGVACIFVHEPKKTFYRKFLHEPFPVESSLHEQLHNHMNAEIAMGTIRNKRDCLDYLSWTYFFRRLGANPSYYQLDSTKPEAMEIYLRNFIDSILNDLKSAGCILMDEDDFELVSTNIGHIASYYYLDYKTVAKFQKELKNINKNISLPDLITIFTDAQEFSELPVRHNEELLNDNLASTVSWPVTAHGMESPHAKTFLLLQAHCQRLPLPISDYINDTKSVLDQVSRVLNAFIDIAADNGYFDIILKLYYFSQMVAQGLPESFNELLQLPHMTPDICDQFSRRKCSSLKTLLSLPHRDMEANLVRKFILPQQCGAVLKAIDELPLVRIDSVSIRPVTAAVAVSVTVAVPEVEDDSGEGSGHGTGRGSTSDVSVAVLPEPWTLLSDKNENTVKYSETFEVAVRLLRVHGRGKSKTPGSGTQKAKSSTWSVLVGKGQGQRPQQQLDQQSKELCVMKKIIEMPPSHELLLRFQNNNNNNSSSSTMTMEEKQMFVVHVISDTHAGVGDVFTCNLQFQM
eukprot:gene4134-8214_t